MNNNSVNFLDPLGLFMHPGNIDFAIGAGIGTIGVILIVITSPVWVTVVGGVLAVGGIAYIIWSPLSRYIDKKCEDRAKETADKIYNEFDEIEQMMKERDLLEEDK